MPRWKRLGAGEAGRTDEGDAVVRDEGALEDRVVALGGAHAERVPGLLDAVAGGVARQEGVDDARVLRVARVHAVEAEVGPDGREAAEDLVAGELPATIDALGLRVERRSGTSLPDLAVAGGEDLAARRLPRGSSRSCGRRRGTGRRRCRSSRGACSRRWRSPARSRPAGAGASRPRRASARRRRTPVGSAAFR